MTVDAQPGTAAGFTILTYNPQAAIPKLTSEMSRPSNVIARKGRSENDGMSSKENASILESGYLEVPATLSLRS